MNDKKVCLVIVFNHRFDKNIDILKNIYKGRFSCIKFLVPFYNGEEPDVIPVYDSSFQFEGYFAQGLRDFYNEIFDYYFFVADDIVLKKEINEDNIFSFFNLKEGQCFIDSMKKLTSFYGWGFLYEERYYKTLKAFEPRREVNFEKELPTIEEALDKIEKYGFDKKDLIVPLKALLNFHNGKLKFSKNEIKDFAREFFSRIYFMLSHLSHTIKVISKAENYPFPLFCGWSDIMLIDKCSIKEFCRLSGVFASQRIFAEIAIPTALSQSANDIKTSENNPLFLGTLTHDELQKIETKYGYNVKDLLDDWPMECCYLHPFKLSKWRYE